MPIVDEANMSLLGLTKNEEIVLQQYLLSGESIAADIAVLLEMDKSTVYKVSDELWKKGFLVRKPKARGTTYIPTDALFLEKKLQQVKAEYTAKFANLNAYIEELKLNAISNRNRTYITVEKGYEAHKRAMRRLLDSKDKLIRQKLNTNHKMYNAPDYRKFLTDEYIPARIQKGINIRILMQYSNYDYFKSINTTNPKELKEVRILSGEFNNPHSFKVYDDYFDITVYGQDEMPELSISIHDSLIANMMKEIYDFMWGRSPVYYADAQLPTRKLYDGVEIPIIGFGTRGLYSKDAFGKAAFLHENPFYDEVRALDNISYNFSKGITYVDNCQKYGDGLAVKLTAFALRNYPRSKIFHNAKITKVNESPLIHPDQITQQCDWYLKQYETDYMDSLQIHGPSTIKFPISEAINRMDNLIDQGKVKYLSVSNFNVEQLQEAITSARHPIVTNEVLYNYNARDIETSGVYDFCRSNNILIVAYRPLGLGTLCGQEEDPENGDSLLVSLAKKYNKTSGQIALNWLLHKDNTVALIKSTNSTHINENVGSIGWEMTEAEYSQINSTVSRKN
jgi:diketogulonate reductase-like aldo/keto reductase/sugar-specific transcriptional regulator TrmB